jgi:hypothetical protein
MYSSAALQLVHSSPDRDLTASHCPIAGALPRIPASQSLDRTAPLRCRMACAAPNNRAASLASRRRGEISGLQCSDVQLDDNRDAGTLTTEAVGGRKRCLRRSRPRRRAWAGWTNSGACLRRPPWHPRPSSGPCLGRGGWVRR